MEPEGDGESLLVTDSGFFVERLLTEELVEDPGAETVEGTGAVDSGWSVRALSIYV